MYLHSRGITDDAGNVLLKDYPFAHDGLLIWNVLHEWFAAYVALYYKSDDDVADDEELQAWWNEIQVG